MRRISCVASVLFTLALVACKTNDGTPEYFIFAKQLLTPQNFQEDLASCGAYVKEHGASDSEQSGAAVAGFIFGGIIGGIAAHSAYEESKDRLNDECMYRSGYRRIALPERVALTYEDQGTFYDRAATADLAAKGELDQAILWSKAFTTNNKDAANLYLDTYPGGLFAKEAKSLLGME